MWQRFRPCLGLLLGRTDPAIALQKIQALSVESQRPNPADRHAEFSAVLAALAARLIWWESAEWAQRHPERVIAQVMDLGTFEDVQRLRAAVDDQRLRQVLSSAQAGWFSTRSWSYWHRMLNPQADGSVPELPSRRLSP